MKVHSRKIKKFLEENQDIKQKLLYSNSIQIIQVNLISYLF